MERIVKRQIPTSLPPADIYLDDLSEIVDILTSAFNSIFLKQIGSARLVGFAFEVDDEYRSSSIEELAEHGGETSRFTLIAKIDLGYETPVSQFEHPVLDFRDSSPTTLRLLYENEDIEWSSYARVAEVFKTRGSRLREFGRDLVATKVLFFTYPFFFLLLFSSFNFLAKFRFAIAILSGAGLLIGILTSGFALYCERRKNYVNLRFRREASLEKARSRKEVLDKGFWLTLGAALGAFLKPVAEWLFAKWIH